MTDRGYARISLDTLASGSIDKQRARIEAFAGPGVEWYPDESVSGSKVPFHERPEGSRLLNDLKQGDRVLVTRIDRAARSVRDLLNLIERIDDAGASIVFVDQAIDTSGPMGRFILVLLGAIAELEAAIIAERRRESLEQFAQEGRHAIGRAPFGFESVPNPNGRGLVIRPHPEEGAILRDAIARVLGGETQESVAQSLGMSKSGFARLLRNPRLAGMTPSDGGVVMVNGTPRVDPEAALLTMEEYANLQALFDPERAWTRHEGIGPALTCGVCGERLYFQASKREPEYATYRCKRRPAVAVNAAKAEAHVEQLFLDQFGSTSGVIVEWEGSDTERAEAVTIAQIRLQEVRRRQDKAVTDDEEEALMVDYLAAKRALREAEAIPTAKRLVTRSSDRTIAEDWQGASPAEKVVLLKTVGQWVVQPGRGLSIEEKVALVPRTVDVASVMPPLTPLS